MATSVTAHSMYAKPMALFLPDALAALLVGVEHGGMLNLKEKITMEPTKQEPACLTQNKSNPILWDIRINPLDNVLLYNITLFVLQQNRIPLEKLDRENLRGFDFEVAQRLVAAINTLWKGFPKSDQPKKQYSA